MPLDRFANYKLVPEQYIPDNIHQPKIQPQKPKLPLVTYNKAGDPIGFTWNYGDTVYLEFETTGEVTYDPGDPGYNLGSSVEETAFMYLTSKTPSNYPHYTDNGIRLRSDDEETESLEEEGNDEVTSSNTKSAEEYLNDNDDGSKIFQVLIYNFRYEVVAWCEAKAADKVVILSDSFYPSSLVKGTYKLKLNLIDKNAGTQMTLIPSDNGTGDDCIIFIK